ncbi:MAG TPA: acyl-CoA dehydrogenase family protein [Acidimicrobiia bacterium]|jgi:alkylation response protein AidB-like acyl-CoA dehydrogenase|nr:acyl-CoA dehydrogenase family protein [Acidimicrobiia bacterium]
MDFRDSPSEAAFRDEVRAWLAEHLTGEFAELGGRGGPADETAWDTRVDWEKLLGKDRWLGLAWPEEFGGRAASFAEQVIFNEEYAKADAPARISLFGEGLFAPTLLAYGTEDQKRRFLPKIQSVEELWCQGYSEPGAGSDLAGVQTRGVRDGDQWVVNGQKVWTTLAHRAQWCFCVTRTAAGSEGHAGLSYLLIPMDQPGVEVRPLRQMTGTAEFNEVFFSDARTDVANVLGEVDDGWKVAMATLGFERGTAFLSQQLRFSRELAEVVDAAREHGVADDPIVRQELADSYCGVQIMKFNGMRMLTSLVKRGELGPEASIGKLYWSTWHRTLGERALRVLGADGLCLPDDGPGYELDELHRIFLFSRAETIYAGSSEIQRNIIGERVLGLPREPR